MLECNAVSKWRSFAHEVARNDHPVRRRSLFTHEVARNDHPVRRRSLFTHGAARNDHPVRRRSLFTHGAGCGGDGRNRGCGLGGGRDRPSQMNRND